MWNLTEMYAQNLIWFFLELDAKKGRILTSDLSAVKKLELFKNLTLRWVPNNNWKSEILAIHKEADSLRTERNKIVHGAWGHEAEAPRNLRLVQIMKTEQKILPRAEVWTATELSAVAKRIAALNSRFRALTKKIGAPPP
jgi:hypothetical protein